MNSRTSNTDRLQTDDTNGARAIYGSASPPSSNRSPTVTASCNPCTVGAAETSSLRATGSDPDRDALTYQWSAPGGSFSTSTSSSTVWTAPLQPGSVNVTITVQDTRGARATATIALQVIVRDRLTAGGRMLPGQWLMSTNRRYRLVYQTDGNLVLYDDVAGSHVWSSGTPGMTPGLAILQTDGNFVLYNAEGAAYFATRTTAVTNAYLVVQTDGNLVIYRPDGQPVWDRFR